MIVVNCEQGTQEWFSARCGAITASMFEECRKTLKSGPNKGQPTAAAKQYAFRLAVERISGEMLAEEVFENYAMRRGRELEPEARLAHEEAKGILVDQTGIALTDDRCFGASVDGLIDDDGCAEYKCFLSPEKLMHIYLDKDFSDVMAQVQGQLWVTGRAWSDFVLYCPALKSIGKHLVIETFERDEDFIEELEQDLLKFNDLVEDYKDKLHG